ncbi:MAG: hypothetical protein K2G03_03540, partial [Bacilli bacterium]|nr:hypothetical protein [Bacilli bacterium]
LVPIILFGHDVSTNEQTFQIENIADYEMLVLQAMNNNVTLATTVIFKNRFLNYRTHHVYSEFGIIIFEFRTNTSVTIKTNGNNNCWAIITGIKL